MRYDNWVETNTMTEVDLGISETFNTEPWAIFF